MSHNEEDVATALDSTATAQLSGWIESTLGNRRHALISLANQQRRGREEWCIWRVSLLQHGQAALVGRYMQVTHPCAAAV